MKTIIDIEAVFTRLVDRLANLHRERKNRGDTEGANEVDSLIKEAFQVFRGPRDDSNLSPERQEMVAKMMAFLENEHSEASMGWQPNLKNVMSVDRGDSENHGPTMVKAMKRRQAAADIPRLLHEIKKGDS